MMIDDDDAPLYSCAINLVYVRDIHSRRSRVPVFDDHFCGLHYRIEYGRGTRHPVNANSDSAGYSWIADFEKKMGMSSVFSRSKIQEKHITITRIFDARDY